jgi:hypothetical protein
MTPFGLDNCIMALKALSRPSGFVEESRKSKEIKGVIYF